MIMMMMMVMVTVMLIIPTRADQGSRFHSNTYGDYDSHFITIFTMNSPLSFKQRVWMAMEFDSKINVNECSRLLSVFNETLLNLSSQGNFWRTLPFTV